MNANTLTITRMGETTFTVHSGPNEYNVTRDPRWRCDCPARGMCKHIRTSLACLGLGIGATLTLAANTDKSRDDGLLDGEEFDAEAGRDVQSELAYIRSGREKRNCGC